ncbi:hypothetical protein EYF80_004347 [Liparis tanakae]|uniref:Uncharacterized protein n=1 Tax=Liparis tanakae TaxID=230148 RepID=A0A4Z2J4P4_9TELE|nr:hypothetical protein EYF80_004347 [Liparis tanakae]
MTLRMVFTQSSMSFWVLAMRRFPPTPFVNNNNATPSRSRTGGSVHLHSHMRVVRPAEEDAPSRSGSARHGQSNKSSGSPGRELTD